MLTTQTGYLWIGIPIVWNLRLLVLYLPPPGSFGLVMALGGITMSYPIFLLLFENIGF